MSEQSASAKREYAYALLTGAVGAGLILLAVREQWAQALFTQPKPLPSQVINVSGNDLVPVASALAVAALAGLAAVIATRGVLRRVAGVLLALFGAGAGVAVMSSVTAATVLSVAASKVASPESAAVSGTVGSTTSGSSGGSSFVVSGSTGQAIMTGAPWHVAVFIGALLIFAAGLATALRGTGWPVMSSRYDAPGSQEARGAGAQPGQGHSLDSATMWESLNGGQDPTEDPAGDPASEPASDPASDPAEDVRAQ
ncbi:MAG TPA: Trp biosynthesis-associated membrane protein [Trebonia sp.]|jgi:uncharacterized membrane protein (TIGR02234 family)